MLIDRTYFVGELNIVAGDAPTRERLDHFIALKETELLKDVLGLPLYRAMITGLSASTVAQKWTDLLQGVDYSYYGYTHEWRGLIEQPADVVNAINAGGCIPVVVGRGHTEGVAGALATDPVVGTATLAIPSALVGKQFSFEQRAFGPLVAGIDYTVAGSLLTLTGGKQFAVNDVYYWYSGALITLTPGASTSKRSLVANYVYYWYMRDQVTQSSSVGEVQARTENSTTASSIHKQVRAWNEMSEQVYQLWQFLYANGATYPEWQQCQYWQTWGYGIGYFNRALKYGRINTLNL